MRKRSTKKQTLAERLASPPPPQPSLSSVPEYPAEQFEFKLNPFTSSPTKPASRKKKSNVNKSRSAAAPASKVMKPTGSSPSPVQLKSVITIPDLKELASTRIDSIKRQLDRSHSAINKDIEASHCRLQKRFKIQTQECQQVMDEAEKEYKKISAQINEGREAMKDSYVEFMEAAQASASRLLKTSIPEISKSFEKSLDSLRTNYGVSSTSA